MPIHIDVPDTFELIPSNPDVKCVSPEVSKETSGETKIINKIDERMLLCGMFGF